MKNESERRIATIMFADLSGFTAMSEKMDPEKLTLLSNFHKKGFISSENNSNRLFLSLIYCIINPYWREEESTCLMES